MLAYDNPFSTDRLLKLRYIPQHETWEEILQRLEALRFRAAIVGAAGSGKTTLLEDLVPFVRKTGFVTRLIYLSSEDKPSSFMRLQELFAQIDFQHVILVDSAELMPRPAWALCRWLCRNAAGLIITAHTPGRLPTLVHCTTSPELFSGLIRQLLGKEPEASSSLAEEVYRKHQGNIRRALLDYYDAYAARG